MAKSLTPIHVYVFENPTDRKTGAKNERLHAEKPIEETGNCELYDLSGA